MSTGSASTSTSPPPGASSRTTPRAPSRRDLLALLGDLVPSYENVHRGHSTASQRTTAAFEESYDTIAA
jgi:selenocysteine lyase/cysteine desulfurase